MRAGIKSKGRVALFLFTLVGAVCMSSAPALAASEGPGWELYASSYPTNFGAGVDQTARVTTNEATGTFKLNYGYAGQETKALSDQAKGAEVQAALEELPSIGAGNVKVAGTPKAGEPTSYTVTFVGARGDMPFPELEGSGASVSNTTKGGASGTIGIDVFNIGAAHSSGPVTVTDTLPAGVKAKEAGKLDDVGGTENFGIDPAIVQEFWDCAGNGPGSAPSVAGATVVTCTTSNAITGGGGTPTSTDEEQGNRQPEIGIAVETEQGAPEVTKAGVEGNHVSIAGGEAPVPASTTDPVTISKEPPAKEGLIQADAWLSNANGTVDRQAGSHPYAATFVFNVATALNAKHEGTIVGSEIKDLETDVPPGLVGDLHEIPRCTRQQLLDEGRSCPAASIVGRLVTEQLGVQANNPVFNMVPRPGAPAELGFFYEDPVYISFDVKTGSTYGIVAHINNVPEVGIFQSILTLWGVPAESSHDAWRYGIDGCGSGDGQNEIEGPPYAGVGEINYCRAQSTLAPSPFLVAPTSCGEVQPYVFRGLSGWQNPAAKSEVSFSEHDASDQPAGFSGCESLAFEPAITTSPDTAKSDTPAGLTVEVKPPLGSLQEAGGLSSADLKNTVVALPAGLVINPGQAAGLQACQTGDEEGGDDLPLPGENGEEERFDGPAKCPNASKIGTVSIKTPLIEADEEKQFEGNVFLLQSNPPEIKLLVAASADGVNLKLVGAASLCENTGEVLDGKTCEAPGQLITAFDETPQLPFTVFKLSFSGGAQAALDTPAQCGTYTSIADSTPWSSPFIPDFGSSASFGLSEGPDGTSCPSNPMPFSPTLTAGATTDQAGGFTSFSMLLQRGDGQQRIEKLSFTAPKGLSGMISRVPLCDEADANAGTCPASSHIGHAVVTSGPGPYPLVIPQPGEPEAGIFLTGPYKGAPFGLSIVTPVIVGPFNLGTIVTRASIAVDPHTAQITVTTDPLPQIVKGVPTDLREVDAVIDRPGFMFNPTNCTPQSFSGTATSVGGAANAGISTPFQVGSCAALKFAPKFAVSTPGKTTKANGAGLTAKLTYPTAAQSTQANITRVKVDLPKQLPSRLTTLQKACTNAQFELNPANCPKESKIGYAKVTTALLPVPLEGPAIFVSHGGEAFPSLTMVLQGDNVTVDLVGTTFISHAGITSTTFKTVPDVPFSTFTLTLGQGKFSALAANLPVKDHGNFCGQTLKMPTEFLAQDGAKINESTPISVSGCPKAHKAKKTTKKKGKSKKK